MSLSPLDDFPVHQIAEPIRRVGIERPQLLRPLLLQPPRPRRGALPDRRLRRLPEPRARSTGSPSSSTTGQHTVVRASRELGADRMDTTVGPFRVEVIEGLRRLRVVLEPNEWDFSFDLTFDRVDPGPGGAASLLAPERAGHLRHLPARPDRPVGGPHRPPRASTSTSSPNAGGGAATARGGSARSASPSRPGSGPSRPASMFWNYAQIQFDDYSMIYMAQEDQDGSRVLEEAVRVWNDPDRPAEHLGSPEPRAGVRARAPAP